MSNTNPPHDNMEPLNYPKDGGTKGKYRALVVTPQNKTELGEQGAKFDLELKEILRKGDVFRFRNFLSKSGRSLPSEMMLDTVKMETMLHQLILTMPDLADIHQRSQDWLDGNTMVKTKGLTLLQASSLSPLQKKQLLTPETENNNGAASVPPTPPTQE
jgi:hypothetical protein